jgi:predicted amidohydrolase YtcJ
MTILTNARIHTLDERGTVADTLVVRDGRVAFVGRRATSTRRPGSRRSISAGEPCCPGWSMPTAISCTWRAGA